MEQRDFAEFATTLAGLGEIFGKEVSAMMQQTYWAVLRRMSLSDFKMAVGIHLETGKWFPKPAELIETVIPDVKSKAVIAFDRLIDALNSTGTYNSVVFDDPAIHSVVEAMGGWVELGAKEQNDVWFRKEFERLYPIYCKKIHADGVVGVPLRLVGRCELSQNQKGTEVQPPKMIGDTSKIDCWQKKARQLATGEQADQVTFSQTVRLLK